MSELPPGFECDAPVEGYYSATEHYWIIRPRSEYTYVATRNWLCIGGPGVDGIEFGLLRGEEGVYAFYPITGDYVRKAACIDDLLKGWSAGTISV